MRTLDLSPEARARRTDQMLAHWAGKSNEWRMLHGILCMSHGLQDVGESMAVDMVYDGLRIAERLDFLNSEALKG